VPEAPEKEIFGRLPESERWQELNARTLSTSKTARSGTVRTTVLTNRRQTLAVLGYIGAKASTFERLSLAGRMLKEASGRNPQSVGLLALGDASAAQSGMEALLAATKYGGEIMLHGSDLGQVRDGFLAMDRGRAVGCVAVDPSGSIPLRWKGSLGLTSCTWTLCFCAVCTCCSSSSTGPEDCTSQV